MVRSFWLLFIVALVMGAVIMRIATLPSWDDSGVACVLIFLSTGVLGFLNPPRAWVFAFAVSSWVALLGLAHGNPPALFALVVGLGGAYVGAYARRLLAAVAR